MLLTPEIATLFPSLGKWDKRYSWSLFEVGRQPGGCLIALGTLEEEGGETRGLDVLAVDLTEREGFSRTVMRGEGRLVRSAVKVTNGNVEVLHARLRGQGVGTLVFNVVTAWAQRTFPGRDVVPVTIISPGNGAAFDQLARFYARFGFAWDRPADGWGRHFPSKPMTVDALKQYPEELLADVRRVDLTAGLTAMIDRMLEADDARRMIAGLREQLADRRDRWLTIGYRLNLFGYALAALAGFGVAHLLTSG